ncbi:Radical SAM superfamily enzyme YgiQ, UPF0313 family [Desulfonauticus submarinus]|uniref:Radical SAM superfamily enzyme YgiQ, UPF0313 family n=1 Tax=Desulfonauticus submarinus TaxID=206665 RepID=A0A1H0CTA2_9BACT|nr:radical SAM protein [Desulfonauticus submarinus]SDN61094.1 Radical SAM superfamily enzyme YgiQ, UPF0313 family [Desulfonauticus submarinus]
MSFNLDKEILFWGRDKVPSREWGGRLPIALIFPEKKNLALSTLGWQAVFRSLIKEDDFVVERFCGQGEDEKDFKSLDNHLPLSSFPIWCFSLNFELDALNILRYLKKHNFSLKAQHRTHFPLLIGGGPLAFLNPFPLLPAFDFMFVGESEKDFVPLLQNLKRAYLQGAQKNDLVELALSWDCVLTKEKKARRVFQSSFFPAYSLFVSNKSAFPDTFLLEINRGCLYGCRFCAAGYIYRPFREISLKTAKEIIKKVQPKKVGLVGTALTDWPYLKEFLYWLAENKIKFSLSSLRIEALDKDFLIFLRKQGIRSITLAVEGISLKIRQSINKKFPEKKFWEVVSNISKLQFNTLKLYFILGFPNEQEDDFKELEIFLNRLNKVRAEAKGKKKKGLDLIQISASILVPKPWTPLQWIGVEDLDILEEKIKKFKKIVKKFSGIRFSGEKPILSHIQAVLARGDEQTFSFIETALNENSWIKAYKKEYKKIKQYLKEKDKDTVFPWDNIIQGINKEYLYKEFLFFYKQKQTSSCKKDCFKCSQCGISKFIEGKNEDII